MIPVTASVIASWISSGAWQHVVPAIHRQRSGHPARPLQRADNDGKLEAAVDRFVLEPLHDGNRVIADVFDTHTRRPLERGQRVNQDHPERMIAEVAVPNAPNEDACH